MMEVDCICREKLSGALHGIPSKRQLRVGTVSCSTSQPVHAVVALFACASACGELGSEETNELP